MYFTQGSYCNLHSGPSTLKPDGGSIFQYYDYSCFTCIPRPTCSIVSGIASPTPSGSLCGVQRSSTGAGLIIALTSRVYTVNVAACASICLQTTGCTSVYFEAGLACNLYSESSTSVANSNSPWSFYDVSCFNCAAATIQRTSATSFIVSTKSLLISTSTTTSKPATAVVTTSTSVSSTTAFSALPSCGQSCFTDMLAQYSELGCANPIASCLCANIYFQIGLGECAVGRCGTDIAPTVVAYGSAYCTSTTSILSTTSVASISQAAWTSIETDAAKYNMALTTVYTQSPQCTSNAITQMSYGGPYLWENSIQPVQTSTITTCFPSQFYSSVMGMFSSVALPAFSALVCPYEWETFSYNSTYIVCCPK